MLILLSFACKPPPPAPEGLDEVTSYMVREFYSDDAMFEAGIQGFMNWYNTEGYELVGVQADNDNTNTFTLNDLQQDDINYLPLEEDGRDLTRAKGVISLAEMACSWKEAEAYLLRKDQDVVFSEDWEGYEREYLGDRPIFETATQNEEFLEISDSLSPFEDSFDPKEWSESIMMTLNQVNPTPLYGIDIPSYEMHLDFRHGVYIVDEVEIGVSAILTYNISGVYDESGNNGLAQSYSIELNIEQEDKKTLRTLAVWAEPVSNIIEPDSSLSLNYAVNKSLASSEQISDICAGEIEIDAE